MATTADLLPEANKASSSAMLQPEDARAASPTKQQPEADRAAFPTQQQPEADSGASPADLTSEFDSQVTWQLSVSCDIKARLNGVRLCERLQNLYFSVPLKKNKMRKL